MKTKHSMDVFGEALKAYYSGDKSKFYLKEPSGKLAEVSLKRYFRKVSQLSKMERKLASLAYGDILDVGCGTGNYIPLLTKRGKVLAFDISKNVIDIAKMSGCKNCIVADIFTFNEKKKYDTITFFENGLGMGGSIDKTKKLLKKLTRLLKDGGQILATSRNIPNRDYFSIKLNPVWKNKIGPKFGWVHFNIKFLSGLCDRAGLNLKILQGNQSGFLVRIVKK